MRLPRTPPAADRRGAGHRCCRRRRGSSDRDCRRGRDAATAAATTAMTRALVRAVAALITQVAPHRCASRKVLRSGLRTEPTFWASTVPFLNRISVGMLRMPNFGGVCGFDSMSILATRSVLVLRRDLVEDRRDHLAGPAPLGPEVQQDGFVGLEHVLAERSVRGVHDVRVTHGERPPLKSKIARDRVQE